MFPTSTLDVERCLYCLGTASDDDTEIIKPCSCKLVHRSCLDAWRCDPIRTENFTRCEICHEDYVVETIQPVWGPCIVRLYVASHVACVLLAALLGFGALAALTGAVFRRIDLENKDGLAAAYPELANAHWPWILAGAVILFAIIGVVVVTVLICAACAKGGGGAAGGAKGATGGTVAGKGSGCGSRCDADLCCCPNSSASASKTPLAPKTVAATKAAFWSNAVCCIVLALFGVVFGAIAVWDVATTQASVAKKWAELKLDAKRQIVADRRSQV